MFLVNTWKYLEKQRIKSHDLLLKSKNIYVTVIGNFIFCYLGVYKKIDIQITYNVITKKQNYKINIYKNQPDT